MTELPTLDPLAAQQAIEYCYAQGWSDGFPLVPPSEDLLADFLARTPLDSEQVIATAEHLGTECTVAQAAINAIMAGCLPEYFPVLLAAIEALWGGDKGVNPLLASTTGPAPLLVINGPVRNALAVNCQGNVFGPGFRANATIGRALRLIVLNVVGLRPHELDQACQSTPAKYTFCIGENEEESPWEPLHVEMGFSAEESAVSGYMARGTMHVEFRHSQDPEFLLLTIADAMSYAGAAHYYGRCPSAVVMGPEHAQLLARQGWSKARVKQFLWENFGRTIRDLRRLGRGDFEEHEPGLYAFVERAERARMPGAELFTDDTFVHFSSSPGDIMLVVAGAFNAGVSTVVPALGVGTHNNRLIAPVRFPA